jgi:tRNA pseudouridine55 synthase
MNGIIVMDKPTGITSHDAVAKVKRAVSAKKVGHLGILDPIATGVLPLVINGATKFARFLEGDRKEYQGTMKLGEETDTYDSEGRITKRGEFGSLTENAIMGALKGFTGRVKQIPPMYSAVKLGGTPLYKLARKGIVVERSPKDVAIFSIDVAKVEPPYVEFYVKCSRGTYLRTLCYDVGRILGCGAHLASLRRTRSGPFSIEDSVSLDSDKDTLRRSLIPLETLLNGFKPVNVGREEALMIRRGDVPAGCGGSSFFSSLTHGEMVRFVHNEALLALAHYSGGGTFKLEKVFH